jgi:hypothetical protein
MCMGVIQEVALDDAAATSEVEAVRAVLESYGFAASPIPNYSRRSGGVLPWVVQIVVATPFVAFFASFGTEAGKDTYEAFKSFISELRDARATSLAEDGAIEVIDIDSTHVVLPSGLPAHAIDALASVDWAQETSGYLIWDEAAGIWKDPLRRRAQT